MKYCKDCKHFDSERRDRFECTAWNKEIHPVHGTAIDGIEASFARAVLCGWDEPKRFESKTDK